MIDEGGERVAPHIVPVEPLTREAFAPYGEVIDCEGVTPIAINDGTALKFADLATVELAEGGEAAMGIYRAQPRALPMPLGELERHPLGSQAFVPLQPARYLVVVAGRDGRPEPGAVRAFLVSGQRGINLHAGVWHHALLALDREAEFLVVDRRGAAANLERIDTASWQLAVQG